MMQIKNPATGFWERVPEPRRAAVASTVAYLATAFSGLAGALYPPEALAAQVSPWMLTYWGFLLLFGGLLGAWSVLPGLYWMERIAIVACSFGLAIYGVAVWFAYVGGMFYYPEVALPWLGFLVAMLAHLGARLAHVRHGLRDPERFSTYGKDT